MNQSINTDSKNSKEPQQKYRLGTVSIKILGDKDEDSTETCCDRHLEIPGVSNNTLEYWSKRKPTVEPRWAKQQTKKKAYLLRLTDPPTYQPINQGWLTDQHTSLSSRVDWPTNILAYLSALTDWPTYHPISPGWLTDKHTSISMLDGWPTNTPAYLYLTTYLMDSSTNIPAHLSRLSALPTHQPINPGRLTDRQTSLSIKVAWSTNIPACLSGSTDQPIYLTI